MLLREWLVQQRQDLAAADVREQVLVEFLNGTGANVTLGPLLAGYLHAVGGGSTPTTGSLRQMIATWPQAALILEADAASRKRREKNLHFVLDRRNACAHATSTITAENLQRLWDTVLGDPRDGFLRYFVAAQLMAGPRMA